MNLEDDNIIGIVGGMGPHAGLALFDNILKHSDAETDQQHLSVMLMSMPKYIGDRTLFLEGVLNINPAINLAKIIKKLEKAGAKIIGMACNTVYSPAIFDAILKELRQAESKVRVLNMPHETCRYIKLHHKNINRIGIMTTNGTYKSEIYKNELLRYGYQVIVPDYDFQNDVIHKMIYDPDYGIKAKPQLISKEVRLLMDKALLYFQQNKADAIILGCTDLSLMLTKTRKKGILILDSTEILAKALIEEVTKNKPNKINNTLSPTSED